MDACAERARQSHPRNRSEHGDFAMIKFDAVTKQYPDGTVAVDKLELVAPTGQITVFVGPSGCRKTTSLRMINRMIEPSSGNIWLDDQDTARVAPPPLRRRRGHG